MMRILYYSDRYTYKNMGTKRSIFEELQSRGIEVKWVHRKQKGGALEQIEKTQPDQVWLAHSGLRLPSPAVDYCDQNGILLVGINMSDPYRISSRTNVVEDMRRFDPRCFDGVDIYVTNHWDTYRTFKDRYSLVYLRTACDFRFHKQIEIERDYPLTLFGTGRHLRFVNPMLRLEMVEQLRKNHQVIVFGNKWPEHEDNLPPIQGEKLRKVICRTQLGLDIQDPLAPLAHRMFEYAGCGTPCITRRRPEVLDCFEEDKEILTYDFDNEFYHKISFYLRKPNLLEEMGRRAYERCKKEHNISHRIDKLLADITEITGIKYE